MRIIHPRWYRPTPLAHGLDLFLQRITWKKIYSLTHYIKPPVHHRLYLMHSQWQTLSDLKWSSDAIPSFRRASKMGAIDKSGSARKHLHETGDIVEVNGITWDEPQATSFIMMLHEGGKSNVLCYVCYHHTVSHRVDHIISRRIALHHMCNNTTHG